MVFDLMDAGVVVVHLYYVRYDAQNTMLLKVRIMIVCTSAITRSKEEIFPHPHPQLSSIISFRRIKTKNISGENTALSFFKDSVKNYLIYDWFVFFKLAKISHFIFR